uniref:Secreted protein n=1 Tax=Taenia asiatica TaxID=60517 RepID=A0A0R3W4X1_TAEAS
LNCRFRSPGWPYCSSRLVGLRSVPTAPKPSVSRTYAFCTSTVPSFTLKGASGRNTSLGHIIMRERNSDLRLCFTECYAKIYETARAHALESRSLG